MYFLYYYDCHVLWFCCNNDTVIFEKINNKNIVSRLFLDLMHTFKTFHILRKSKCCTGLFIFIHTEYYVPKISKRNILGSKCSPLA